MARDKKKLSPLMLWLEDAWEGWIRPLGALLLLALAYLLYNFEVVGEQTAGASMVVAVVVGAILAGVLPAWPLTRAPWHRALLVTLTLAALAGMVYPPLRVAAPGHLLAQGTLTAEKPTLTLTTGGSGPYDVSTSGHFKDVGRADTEVSYSLKVSDGSGGSDEVSGEIARKQLTIRSRKGQSSSIQEHSEETRALPHVRGPEVTVAAEADFDKLESGLKVELRHGSRISPVTFLVLSVLALLMALVLDTRLIEPKLPGKQKSQKTAKSHLTACLAIAFVFALRFPEEATLHHLVKPAVSALLQALLGGLAGWLIAGLARVLFAPKIKKTAAPVTRR
jgi:hypothetical protein